MATATGARASSRDRGAPGEGPGRRGRGVRPVLLAARRAPLRLREALARRPGTVTPSGTWALAGVGDAGWVVDTPPVGLPRVPVRPEVTETAARQGDGAAAARRARRLAGPVPTSLLGAAAAGTRTPDPERWAPWRVAALAAAWLGLAACWFLAPGLPRLTDVLTFVALLGLAALTPLLVREAAGGERLRHGLRSVWMVPVALLLPPAYALVAHLPLCLLPPDGTGPARRGRSVAEAIALGIAGASASVLHTRLAASDGPYTAQTLVGSPSRCAALGAAAVTYAFVRWLALPPGATWTHHRPAGECPQARPPLGLPALGARAAELCAAVAVAALWAANPLLLLAAAPPALLLARSLPPDDLLAAARTDPKTRLANAAWWREVAESELARARRSDRPLCVLLVDIDHFKQVNDRYGHLFGDQVLGAVADALRAAVRPWDLVGRFGGEEFVVLLADVDLPTAAQVSERVRGQVAAAGCPLEGPGGAVVSVTVSVGAAQCGPGDSLADILGAADAALYRAKRAGRDRVELATPVAAAVAARCAPPG